MPDPIPQTTPADRWAEAERLYAGRQLDQAEGAYRQLLSAPSHAPVALVRLSMIAALQGRCRDEAEAAMAAFKARPPVPGVLQVIASRLRGAGESRAMLACAIDPVVLESGDAKALAEMGRLLANAHFPREALELLERARGSGFIAPTLRFVIGVCRMYVGEDEVARREFEALLARIPHHAPSLGTLSRLQSTAAEDEALVDRIRAALAELGADHQDAPALHHALFDLLDRRDRRDEAWAALEEGMRLRRAQVEFDDAADQALFDYLATLRAPAPAGEAGDGPRPVFIVGMPGSGTSLLERVLGRHEQVADAGELPDFVQQLRWCCDRAGPPRLDLALARRAEAIDFEELGIRYLARTWWRGGDRTVYTDRTPSNFTNLSYILRALPHARILHVVRSPMDTCFAGLSDWWWTRADHYSHDQHQMADRFRRYRALMAHWRALYPERILDVRYEELVEDPEKVMAEVLSFCDLPPQQGISDVAGYRGAPAANSDNQRPEPIHARDVDRWRRYEQRLQPLRVRLGALAY